MTHDRSRRADLERRDGGAEVGRGRPLGLRRSRTPSTRSASRTTARPTRRRPRSSSTRAPHRDRTTSSPTTSLGQTQQLHLRLQVASADACRSSRSAGTTSAQSCTTYLQQRRGRRAEQARATRSSSAQAIFTGMGGRRRERRSTSGRSTTARQRRSALDPGRSQLAPRAAEYYTITAHFLGKARVSKGTLMLDNRIDSVFGRGWSILASASSTSAAPPPQRTTKPVITVAPRATRVFQPGVRSGRARGARVHPDGRARGVHLEPRRPDDLEHLLTGRGAALPDGIVRPSLTRRTRPRRASATGRPAAPVLVGEVARPLRQRHRVSLRLERSPRVDHGPVGLKTTFDLYRQSRLEDHRPGRAATTKLGYSGKDLTSIIDPDGSKRTFGYDPKGRMTPRSTSSAGTRSTCTAITAARSKPTAPTARSIKMLACEDQGLPKHRRSGPARPSGVRAAAPLGRTRGRYTFRTATRRSVSFNERGQVLEARDDVGLLEKFQRDNTGNALTLHGRARQGHGQHLRRARQSDHVRRRTHRWPAGQRS